MSPAQIQSPRVMERLFRAFGIQGKHPLSLDNTVVPVAIVEDLSDRATDFLGEAWVFIRCNATAAVGGSIQLTNAGLASSVDLKIEEFGFSTLAAAQCGVKQTSLSDGALLLGVQQKIWSDTNQLPGVPPGVPDHRDGSAYAGATNLINRTMVATVEQRYSPGWVLAPGEKFVITCSTVNVRLQTWIRYSVSRRIAV